PQLEEDLGADPDSVFAELAHVPMAAASLAQAHAARLHDGTAVVLKVRRPGIREVVEADLRLLRHVAVIVEKQMPELARFHPVEILRQFAASLLRELDFAAECRNAERVARNFQGDPRMVVPKVYWQWTSERLNVEERLEGIPGNALAAVDAAVHDHAELARTGAEILLKMVLEDGFFQADPHPGNIFYMPGVAIGVIDFGMVGHL